MTNSAVGITAAFCTPPSKRLPANCEVALSVAMHAASQKSKWICCPDPEMPVTEVAREAVAARLEPVWSFLPLAAECYLDDTEYIHQLRVSTRRGMAALSIFRDALPPAKQAKVSRWLKRIRRSAGPARDDDVLIERLSAMAARMPSAGMVKLLSQVKSHRHEAQQAVEDMYRTVQEKELRSVAGRLVEKGRWRGGGTEPTFRQAAQIELREKWRSVRSAAEAELSAPAHLHQLRIEGKRLRYSMEVFVDAFADSFRTRLYPQIEQLQELLGQINDHAVAAERFRQWQERAGDRATARTLEEMQHGEQVALSQDQQQFDAWWTRRRQADLEAEFGRYLVSD